MVNSVPDGYHSLTPYVTFRDGSAAIDWYVKFLGATEVMRLPGPGGVGIGHAELKFGDSHLMLADENPEMENRSIEAFGGSPVAFMLYVDDVDSAFAKALEAGATKLRDIANQFYGDRSGTLQDPYGYKWTLATHIEDVSPEEIDARLKAMSAGNA
jgi:PhnB protein